MTHKADPPFLCWGGIKNPKQNPCEALSKNPSLLPFFESHESPKFQATCHMRWCVVTRKSPHPWRWSEMSQTPSVWLSCDCNSQIKQSCRTLILYMLIHNISLYSYIDTHDVTHSEYTQYQNIHYIKYTERLPIPQIRTKGRTIDLPSSPTLELGRSKSFKASRTSTATSSVCQIEFPQFPTWGRIERSTAQWRLFSNSSSALERSPTKSQLSSATLVKPDFGRTLGAVCEESSQNHSTIWSLKKTTRKPWQSNMDPSNM